jgi:hypothetical protein
MMTRALLMAAGVFSIAAIGACTPTQSAQEQQTTTVVAAPAAPAAPSPRSECAQAHVTLYFTEAVASDEPVVTPLLTDFMNQIRACESAGGELRSITIVTAADPGQSASDARAQIRRRQDRVRAALVNIGAPTDKIVYGEAGQASQGAVMSRRAEITADLY